MSVNCDIRASQSSVVLYGAKLTRTNPLDDNWFAKG